LESIKEVEEDEPDLEKNQTLMNTNITTISQTAIS
jgi:hypothetical protein